MIAVPGFKNVAITSLVPGPSHVFQHTQEKSGRPGRSGDVTGCGYVSPHTQ